MMRIIAIAGLFYVVGCASRTAVQPGHSERAHVPIEISASVLTPDEMRREGYAFFLTVRNRSDSAVLLDYRCLWATVRTEARPKAGDSPSCFLPPTPVPVFPYQRVVRLEPGEAVQTGVPASTLLSQQTFGSPSNPDQHLAASADVTVSFIYSGASLWPSGVGSAAFRPGKDVWPGIAESNALTMHVSQLRTLYARDMARFGYDSEGSFPREVEESKADFILWISNESCMTTPVDISIVIDGNVVFKGEVPYDPYETKVVPLALRSGVHLVSTTAWRGRVFAETKVLVREKRWCRVTFWHTPEGKEVYSNPFWPATLEIECADKPFPVW